MRIVQPFSQKCTWSYIEYLIQLNKNCNIQMQPGWKIAYEQKCPFANKCEMQEAFKTTGIQIFSSENQTMHLEYAMY